MQTTLNKIKLHQPCEDEWEKLLNHLGKTEADDELIELRTILESNGVNDTIWAFRAVDGKDKEIGLFSADCAELVLPIFEKQYPNDDRPRKAIQAARDYANGLINAEELEAARAAAWAASVTMGAAWAAREAARDAWYAARAAAWAARDAASAARGAAWAAREAARDAANEIKSLLLKYILINQKNKPMNILNKGFQPFSENGNVTIYNKVLTGKITPKREQSISNWIDTVNKKTNHICYGFFYITKGVKYYHINIEVFNSNEL